jgi:hypothetical protein
MPKMLRPWELPVDKASGCATALYLIGVNLPGVTTALYLIGVNFSPSG